MKMNIESFTPMGTQLLMDTNGGGFAHDVGRVIRFFGLMGMNGINTPNAVADWIINSGEV